MGVSSNLTDTCVSIPSMPLKANIIDFPGKSLDDSIIEAMTKDLLLDFLMMMQPDVFSSESDSSILIDFFASKNTVESIYEHSVLVNKFVSNQVPQELIQEDSMSDPEYFSLIMSVASKGQNSTLIRVDDCWHQYVPCKDILISIYKVLYQLDRNVIDFLCNQDGFYSLMSLSCCLCGKEQLPDAPNINIEVCFD
jgi:hypothetical protein